MNAATPSSANVEKISAMLDGELTDQELDSVLRSLDASMSEAGASHKATWDIYNQIGDVLRSDDLALILSADFSQRLSQRLEAEPVVLAPRLVKSEVLVELPLQANAGSVPLHAARGMRASRSWAFAGVAAAALLTVVAVPQLSHFYKGNGDTSTQMAQTSQPADAGTLTLVNGEAVSTSGANAANGRLPGQIQVLRDPRLDSYLMAHQKFYPSIGSGSRYISDVSDVTDAPASVPVSAPASVSTLNK